MNSDEFLETWNNLEGQVKARYRNLAGSGQYLEDFLQDLFVKVYPHASRLEDSFAKQYLMRAAGNLARDYVKRDYREEYAVASLEELPVLATYETPLEVFSVGERQELYRREILPSILELPGPQYQAIQMYFWEGNLARSARESGIPISTLRSRVETGMRYLRGKVRG